MRNSTILHCILHNCCYVRCTIAWTANNGLCCFPSCCYSYCLTASEATLLYCSPSDDTSSSSMDDLQQVTTLQYCVVDNCTIMRIDTGQKLDVVYTTESIIVINPTDGQTSSVIARDDNELACVLPDSMLHEDDHIGQLIGPMIVSTLIMTVSGYILIVHLLFKQLHNLMGKLMISYNFTIICHCIIIIAWLLLRYQIPVNSQIICHSIVILFHVTAIASETIVTCILTYLVNLMYCSYNLKQMSKSKSKFLFKCYTTYVIGTIIFYLFVTIAYDLKTGNGKYTLDPLHGYCIFISEMTYNTYNIGIISAIFNKTTQIVLLIAYLYYLYKINAKSEYTQRQYSKQVLMVAISMGANIGVSDFIWMIILMVGLRDSIISITGAIFLLIQQCIIMITFMCTPKMSRLCKGLFSKTTNE